MPPGFVVTSAAFERMLGALDATGSIRTRIARLHPNDAPGIRNACADVRQRIENAPLPAELHAMLVEAYRELNGRDQDVPVAVRSSATSEDGEATFAGLQDTFLAVRGIDGVAHCLRSCWASLYSIESVTYRLKLKLREPGVGMGVVVQKMVTAHCSGLLWTRDPDSDDRSIIAIEGSWGLGSGLAGGELTPDRFLVSKVTGDIVNRTVVEKLTQHLPDAIAGGIRREPVPDDLRNVQCLTDAQIAELAQTAKRIERHYGSAQHIEWAIAQGERGVWLLQSRPDTGSASRDSSVSHTTSPKAPDPVISLRTGRQR